MEVIKFNGDREAFSDEKVLRSIVRTGISEEEAKIVVDAVKAKIQDGITTAKLYHVVREELEKSHACYACRYNLRDAILKLGPAGFKFEKYVASILRAHGYKAELPENDLPGSCVMHEVDVIAEKDGKRHFIEVKFRNEFNDFVDLKNTMACWARFLDLCDAEAMGKSSQHFDDPWLITNARFSDRAQAFGTCKGINMIGWKFPREGSFMNLVDIQKLFPVTVISSLTPHELTKLSEVGWMLCKEVATKEPEEVAHRLEISQKRAEEFVQLCSEVVDGKQKTSG
jgi:hypothetical protein